MANQRSRKIYEDRMQYLNLSFFFCNVKETNTKIMRTSQCKTASNDFAKEEWENGTTFRYQLCVSQSLKQPDSSRKSKRKNQIPARSLLSGTRPKKIPRPPLKRGSIESRDEQEIMARLFCPPPAAPGISILDDFSQPRKTAEAAAAAAAVSRYFLKDAAPRNKERENSAAPR